MVYRHRDVLRDAGGYVALIQVRTGFRMKFHGVGRWVWKRGLLSIPLPLIVLLLLSGTVQAGTITWTTTADFNAGTKSSSGGNFEIETNTDNLGISSDAFELGSQKGDSFTFADADGDTLKWNLAAGGGGCASRSIAAGIFTALITSSLAAACTQSSVATVGVGNFDIRLKTSSPIDGDNRQLNFCWYDETGICGLVVNPGTDGYLYRILVDDVLAVIRIVAGIGTQVGTNTDLPGSETEPIWLRISRTGTDFLLDRKSVV